MESNNVSVADFLKANLPQTIHEYNFEMEEELQILSFENSSDCVPNTLMFVQRNLFLIEIGETQHFKFLFVESEILPLLAAGLRRVGTIPPLTQIASSKIPLIEVLVKVRFYF